MFKDKTIVLTGASGGIGSAIATRLSQLGAVLILVDCDEIALQRLTTTIASHHHTVKADLSETAGRQAIYDCCLLFQNGIDMLINAAGINLFSAIDKLNDEQISRMININLVAQIQLTQNLLPLLSKQKQSLIVNIGSTFGSIGFPGFSVYCASKFGLRGFTEALRRELMDTGISVKYFAPRATQTSINDDKVNAMNLELNTKMDSPFQVAEEFVNFIKKPMKISAYVGFPEKLFVKINSLLPNLVDKSIFKQLPVIKRYL